MWHRRGDLRSPACYNRQALSSLESYVWQSATSHLVDQIKPRRVITIKTPILGVYFDRVSLNQATDIVMGFFDGETPRMITTPNPEMAMAARSDPELLECLNQADLTVADGVGVVLASRLIRPRLPERVAGIDLIRSVFQRAETAGLKAYLFGGKPGVAEKAAVNLTDMYPGLHIVGHSDGYFDESGEAYIIDDIMAKAPDLLLVGLGMGKQEKWIKKHLSGLPVKAAIGCGGSLDVFAGTVKRAPAAFRRLGLEWLYRLIKEPSRIKRQLCLPVFAALALATALKIRKNN